MIDRLDLPPERELPDGVHAAARDRLLRGLRDNPGRTNRTMIPLAIAGAVVVLAAAAVGVTALGGFTGLTSTASPDLATIPSRQLPPEDTDRAYHVQYGSAPADLANRCLAEAHSDPAGRPAPSGWQVLLTATNNLDTVLVYRTSAGPVFCELTPTTVALSLPAVPAPASTARPTFITSFGTIAGSIDPNYRAAWIDQKLVGEPAAVADQYQSAVVSDGIFLLPNAIPVPTNGLQLGVSPTLSMADMRTITVVQDQLPAVAHPTTDGTLPPVDQHTAAGERMIACFHQPNSVPVVAPQAWIPGAYLKLDDHDTVQLASLGPNHDLLAVCPVEANQLPGLEIPIQNGYDAVNVIDDNSLITATSIAYDYRYDQQGVSAAGGPALFSGRGSIVGQLISPQVASVRMTWPGGPKLTAVVSNGTYVLPGYDPNDPSLRGKHPTITVYDAHGGIVGSFPVNP